MPKKVSGRGRKREAKRWIADRLARCSKIYPISERGHASFREYEQLRDRDPGLFAAVNAVNWDVVRKAPRLTPEEMWAQWKKRCAKLWRQHCRAKKRAAAALAGGADPSATG